MAAKLSVCMIVKNEEDVLERCLKCAKSFADELIVVDTGSTDNTVRIAKKYADRVDTFQWVEDFAAARNYSFSLATEDYIMWLDADDILDAEDVKKLNALKSRGFDGADVLSAAYHVAFDDRDRPTFSYKRERIFKRAENFVWVGRIHEVISMRGRIVHADFAVKHKKIHATESGRNLRIFKKMKSEGEHFDTRQLYYYARELMYNARTDEAVDAFHKFFERKDGWVENKIDACKDLASCFYARGESEKALDSLFHSFCYDLPRGETCCEIGSIFMKNNQYPIAVFWYLKATECKKKTEGFVLNDCYDFIPYMQLCVCFDLLGDREKAVYFNSLAALIKPDNDSVRHNKAYFEKTKPQ